MRSLLPLLAVLLAVGASCRQRPTSGTRFGCPVAVQLPKEAYLPLTEDDIAMVLRVWPTLERLMDSTDYTIPSVSTLDNTGSQWAKMIDSLRNVAGFETALAGLGTSWPNFRAAAYRIMVTIHAIGSKEGMPDQLKSQLPYVRLGERIRLKTRMAETKQIVSRVPKTNEAVFKPHQRELLDDFYILLQN